MELIASDLRVALEMFDVLTRSARVDHVEHIEITYRTEGSDTITIGYGEQAEPAILRIVDADET